MTTYDVPLKPHPVGSIAPTFGGPATSPADVLIRARAALAPRGAWSSSGWTSKNKEGHGRCLIQAIKDVDGPHEAEAQDIVAKVLREETIFTSIMSFNDSPSTHKHDVLRILDLAIERAT